jgi:hypothetical protein
MGPAGSGAFGKQVIVLPNGKLVVTDPLYSEGGLPQLGAVYLYDGATLSLIGTLKGGTGNDQVGSIYIVRNNGQYEVGSGIAVLSNGNFVVCSPNWNNPAPAIQKVGAVTWCSATTGCDGLVSASNSLVGGSANDQVGEGGVTALSNGNYVVLSKNWNNPSPAIRLVGAVTWGNGLGGTVGLVSACNSVLGNVASGGKGITFAFDKLRTRLVVGYPAGNRVSIFTPPIPTPRSFSSAGGSGTISFTAGTGCASSTLSNVPWIHVSSSADVNFTVDAHTNPTPRRGTITVGGQSFTILQGAHFTDTVGHPFATFTGQLSAYGITQGCGNGNYCPDAPVTRAQMAAFLVRAFNL